MRSAHVSALQIQTWWVVFRSNVFERMGCEQEHEAPETRFLALRTRVCKTMLSCRWMKKEKAPELERLEIMCFVSLVKWRSENSIIFGIRTWGDRPWAWTSSAWRIVITSSSPGMRWRDSWKTRNRCKSTRISVVSWRRRFGRYWQRYAVISILYLMMNGFPSASSSAKEPWRSFTGWPRRPPQFYELAATRTGFMRQ